MRAYRLIVTALALMLSVSAAFAQAIGGSKVSDLPFASAPYSGGELLYLIQNGASKKATIGTLGPVFLGQFQPGYVFGNGTSSAAIGAATPLISVMNQSGSGLGAGVATALGLPTNAAGGVATSPVAASNVASAASAYMVSGSNAATTGTITGATSTLTVLSASDFVKNQGIRVNHAGAAFTLNQPSGGTVTPTGTSGSTTYQYKIASLDANGGVGAAASSFQTTSGNATLSTSNYNVVSWTAATGTAPAGYAVYRNISGTYTLIGVSTSTTFYDFGFTSYTAFDWIPSTASASALADWLVTTISNIASTTFTLAAQATTTATSQNVQHDDTAALSNYFTASQAPYLPIGRYLVTSATAVPTYRDITGQAQWQTVITSAQISSYIFNLNYGDNVSNMTFQVGPSVAAIGVNSVNSINLNKITCQGGAVGGSSALCMAFYSATSVSGAQITNMGWSGIATGQATGGATATIETHQAVGIKFDLLTATNTSSTPGPGQAAIWFENCFNCTVTNSNLNNTSVNNLLMQGIKITAGSQAIIVGNNQILNYADEVRVDNQTSGLLTIDIVGNHFDFCSEACVLLNNGQWFNIVGNSFAGENSTTPNNYGVYFGSSAINGPNTITGNTFDGFSSGTADSISLQSSLANTVVADNVFTHTNTTVIGNLCTTTTCRIHDNPGYNPVGTTSATYATASTSTYTAGPTAETHYLTGGTVTAVKVGTNTVCTSTPCTGIDLGPGETMSVTYSVAPTDIKSVH